MWELLTEKDRMAQKESAISMTIQMILIWQEKKYLPPHLNPFNFDSPRFCGLVQGHLEPRTIWGLGLEIHLHKGVVAKFPAKKFVILPFNKNLHVMRDALPLWQDVAKIFCSQNIPRRLDNIMMAFRQTHLSVVAAKSLVLWL